MISLKFGCFIFFLFILELFVVFQFNQFCVFLVIHIQKNDIRNGLVFVTSSRDPFCGSFMFQTILITNRIYDHSCKVLLLVFISFFFCFTPLVYIPEFYGNIYILQMVKCCNNISLPRRIDSEETKKKRITFFHQFEQVYKKTKERKNKKNTSKTVIIYFRWNKTRFIELESVLNLYSCVFMPCEQT